MIKALIFACIGGILYILTSNLVEGTFKDETSKQYLAEVITEELGREPSEEEIEQDIEHIRSRWGNYVLIVYTLIIMFLICKRII